MANISAETLSITGDTRGEDVRDSVVSACKKISAELLPSVTTEESGYFLTVNLSGVWEAMEWT